MDDNSSWEDMFNRPPLPDDPLVYWIAFTPRSGSTWLGRVLGESGVLGRPLEYFNLKAAKYAIERSGATSMQEYYRYLKRDRQTNGVFGAEVAINHLKKLIDEGYNAVIDETDFWFFLRRRDFVAQSVSLYKARETRIFHSDQSAQADLMVKYDKEKIMNNALQVLSAEYNWAQFFASSQITCEELWYEDMVKLDDSALLTKFCEAIGQPDRCAGIRSEGSQLLKPLANQNSRDLIAQFNEEHCDFLGYWEEYRGHKSVKEFYVDFPQYAGTKVITKLKSGLRHR